MNRERYVVLGLAQVRSPWFREVARWSTSGALAIDFVKCVSADELRAILASGRPVSTLLIDASLTALDRDLVDTARSAGASTIVVDDGRVKRNWPELGVRALLQVGFSHAELATCLAENCTAVGGASTVVADVTVPTAWKGSLITVCGAGGAGASTVAMALARGIACDSRNRGLVALADFARHADQALLHDAGDVVPGVQELVEAHRVGTPPLQELRRLLFADQVRGYSLLLGLRQHRDWTVLRPRAFSAALDSLRRGFRFVVADTDADFEGEDQTGSLDVEERNLMARTAAANATLVVAVANPGVKGIRSFLRVLDDLARLGVGSSRILPVVNRAPRNPRHKAEIAKALAELTGSRLAHAPCFLPERRGVELAARNSRPLADGLCRPLSRLVLHALEHADQLAAPFEPVAVLPGSLGLARPAALGADGLSA